MEDATAEELEKAATPDTDTSAMQETVFRLVASSYMLGLIHAAEEEPGKSLADDIIPAIPFAEAVKFLSAKIPLTKAEWERLEPKIRFRSFTVALLGAVHEIEAARRILAKSLEEGTSYRGTWYQLADKVMAGEGITPAYWENVYRTNTQSAYIAGKLEQYQNSGVTAYQLMVIEDGRTTDICRSLLSRASGYGAVIPAGDKFWKTNGFPPYHYQCRTSIRGLWPSQLKATRVDTARTAPDIRSFEPMAGFGGNPVDRESWWRMTDNMAVQAANHGIFTLIEEQAKAMGLHNFSLNLVSGSDYRRLEGTSYKAEKAGQAKPLQKEIKLARILEEAGHSVYFTPENTSASKLKNYDGIVDGKLAEMKIIESGKIDKITDRLEYCEKQKASVACIQTIAPQYTKQKAIEKIREFLANAKVNNVKEVFFVYDNKVTKIKK